MGTTGRSGTISKTIMVETDHPDHARIPLKLSANVVVDLDFVTTHMRFPDIRVGDTEKQVIEFTAGEPAKVKFDKPVPTGEGVTARILKNGSGADTSWSIEVVFSPTKPGAASGVVDVKLLAPQEKDLKLYYSGRVKGDIEVSPAQVMIRKKGKDDRPESKVVLTSEKSFKVKSAKDEQAMFEVDVEDVEPGKKVELTIHLSDKAAEQERFGSSIKVTTTLASQSELEIPVYVMTHAVPGK